MKKSIISLIIFYFIAVVLRYAYKLYIDSLDGMSISIYYMHLIRLTGGLGPFIGALFCFFILRRKTEYSITGLSVKKSLLSWTAPIALFAIYDIVYAPEISATISMCVLLAYGFLEETGWRGYMQNELEKMGVKDWIIPLIIAPLWWMWHLNFNASLLSSIIQLAAIIGGCYGIGFIMKTTRSIMMASCFHILFNFFMRDAYIDRNAISITIIVLSVVYWLWLWYAKRPATNKE